MHVIVGAGVVGSATARLLAGSGQQVRMVSRSGRGPEHPNIERVAADATDKAVLNRLTIGATTLYNCANPAYHRWPTDWPPLASALLDAAERSGATLVITGNLYGYGPVDVPMTEDLPLATTTVKGRVRVKMWQDALAAHRAGRIKVTEVRASDFLGPTNSLLSFALPSLRAGRAARLPAPLDMPHTFTYTGDFARALVALGTDERAWGRAWHVPSPAPVTIRQLLVRAAEIGGFPPAKPRRIPDWAVRTIGVAVPLVRELGEMSYQFKRPFVLDASLTAETFGLRATDFDQAIRESIELAS